MTFNFLLSTILKFRIPFFLFVGSVPRSSTSNSLHGLEDYESTHRGIHKFIPRHEDEMHIEIGDPIYVEVEADDLWCEGAEYGLDF